MHVKIGWCVYLIGAHTQLRKWCHTASANHDTLRKKVCTQKYDFLTIQTQATW